MKLLPTCMEFCHIYDYACLNTKYVLSETPVRMNT